MFDTRNIAHAGNHDGKQGQRQPHSQAAGGAWLRRGVLEAPNVRQAVGLSLAKAKESFAHFLKNNHTSEKQAMDAMEKIFSSFLSVGSVAAMTLHGTFPPARIVPLPSSRTCGRSLFSVSITTKGGEVRFVLDATTPKDPLLLFVGRKEDAAGYLANFGPISVIRASTNGQSEIFKPLKEYSRAKAEYDAAVNSRQ